MHRTGRGRCYTERRQGLISRTEGKRFNAGKERDGMKERKGMNGIEWYKGKGRNG